MSLSYIHQWCKWVKIFNHNACDRWFLKGLYGAYINGRLFRLLLHRSLLLLRKNLHLQERLARIGFWKINISFAELLESRSLSYPRRCLSFSRRFSISISDSSSSSSSTPSSLVTSKWMTCVFFFGSDKSKVYLFFPIKICKWLQPVLWELPLLLDFLLAESSFTSFSSCWSASSPPSSSSSSSESMKILRPLTNLVLQGTQ